MRLPCKVVLLCGLLTAPGTARAWHWELASGADNFVYLATHCETIEEIEFNGPGSGLLSSSSECCRNTTAGSLEMAGGSFRVHADLTALGTDNRYGALGVASIKSTLVVVADPGDLSATFVLLEVTSRCDPYLGFHDDNGVHGDVTVGGQIITFDRVGGDGLFSSTRIAIPVVDGDTLRIHDPDYYGPWDAGIKLEQDIEPLNCGFAMSAELTILATLYGEGTTEIPITPEGLRLHAAMPNPFNPRTTIRFDLPAGGPVRVSVFDVAGRLIRTLVDQSMPQGRHETVWDGRDASGRDVGSGSYLARLIFDGRVETVRMGLVR